MLQGKVNNLKESKYQDALTYLKANLKDYTELETLFMFDNPNMIESGNFIPSVMRQIYDEVGAFTEDNDLYGAFVNLLEENFDIDSNIVEVGCGVIPSVAKKIRLKQTKGSVTVYDPRLSNNFESTNKFTLKREKFTEDTNIKKADLIIGFMPCEATEILIQQAVRNKKDFLVALCEGGHYSFDDYFDTDSWTESILYLAEQGIKKNKLGELVKVDLKEYGNPYPIIYNKRKVLK